MDDIRKIYTIGYGITTREAFVQRLKDAFPDGDAMIIDIRKKDSGSINPGTWANWGAPMIGTCWASGNQGTFCPELCNPYGPTKKGMARYTRELDRGWRRKYVDRIVEDMLENPETKFCLLCCERKPFTGTQHPIEKGKTESVSWSGKSNCHRTIVAAHITARMWYDHQLKYQAIHLYSEG
jgi:hypothetical protein